MQTFLPYADYTECARVLDNIRLNSQLNEALVIIKSLAGVYKRNKRGESGWEGHTVTKMWVGHELQLARYALAVANEHLKRPLGKQDAVASLRSRQGRIILWSDMIEELIDKNMPDTPPSLVGEEDFHSAFRALLLYKDLQSATYRKWKQGGYPDHAVTRNLPPKKSSWKRDYYIAVWEFFGRPEFLWYGQWGWAEEPDDMKIFYTEDRIPQMQKELERKKKKPFTPFLVEARKKRESTGL